MEKSTWTDSLMDQIANLTTDEKDFLVNVIGSDGVLRKFLSSEDIKKANNLVKLGVLEKGTSDEKNGTKQFYVDSFVYVRII